MELVAGETVGRVLTGSRELWPRRQVCNVKLMTYHREPDRPPGKHHEHGVESAKIVIGPIAMVARPDRDGLGHKRVPNRKPYADPQAQAGRRKPGPANGRARVPRRPARQALR